jgi:hypothetical protein
VAERVRDCDEGVQCPNEKADLFHAGNLWMHEAVCDCRCAGWWKAFTIRSNPLELRHLCVPKTKSERIDDEVRPRWRANLWRRIAEPDERPAQPFAKTDAF